MDRKTFIYSVVTSIVATILFSYGLEPLSVYGWTKLAATSNSVLGAIQDNAISNAAIGKRDWAGPIFIMFGAASICGVCISTYIFTPILIWRLKKKRSSEVEVDNSAERPPKFGRLPRLLYRFSVLPGILLCVLSIQIAFTAMVDLQMNASFSQRLDALGPYIDDQTGKQLKSEWARMEKLEDYRRITSQMDALGQKAGIKLPKVLYR